MANITTYLENKILELTTGKTTYSKPITYIGLFITPPTAAYTALAPNGNEPATDHGYSRIDTSTFGWSPAASGSISNAAYIIWNATGAWNVSTGATVGAPVTHVGIFDASTAGNLLWFGPLSAAVTISSNGDSFTISTGNLVLALS
jgi:hypothetical protein